ncbi:response regulator [Mesorhizobium sp. LHD-90]|uniref:response regulator n=1 Tax=Mesorhizobium sp. LHD-90 TaxID=3071414 RepID=UPI0027E1E0FD|nr:response regulator [Mesorhizobium sp. LHD-90]MDQ6436691.1 response regulator [Mesorhizobium sp. LHD-90]
MAMTISGAGVEPETSRHEIFATEDAPADPLLVLVVGRSRINAVVVSKIVERSGLHPVSESPERAEDFLRRRQPVLVILDGGGANADCEKLMSPLGKIRQAAGRPAVILLSTGNFAEVAPAHSSIVDAVVSKPILPELLQPVVDRFVSRAST